jgi:Cytochrome bd-type quinol oxidase, subunit 1
MLPVYDIDRIVFASSLAIHIIIASITIGMPFAIGTLELYGILKKDESIKNLAQRISTLILVLFAIGTLSGTIVALEIYILFPKFMQIVSNTAIISLYIEILAFFIESLFVGIYFYSFKKYNNSILHPIFMYLIGIFGAMSGFLIITLNAFMNYPVGIEYLNGQYIDINPYSIFFTPIEFIEVFHGILASFEFGLSIFVLFISYKILKEGDIENIKIYGKALKLTIPILFLSILLLGIFGINSIDTLAKYQPVKYATLEANLNGNISNAPENLFGIVTNNYTLIDSIQIPNLQSLLYGSFNPNTIVPGIYANESYIPSINDITIAHNSFDIMAIFGFLIFFISLYGLISLIISKEDKKIKNLL